METKKRKLKESAGCNRRIHKKQSQRKQGEPFMLKYVSFECESKPLKESGSQHNTLYLVHPQIFNFWLVSNRRCQSNLGDSGNNFIRGFLKSLYSLISNGRSFQPLFPKALGVKLYWLRQSATKRFNASKRFDQKVLSLENLHKAEKLFARLAVHLLLEEMSESGHSQHEFKKIACSPNTEET